jgi:hypothetical protein
MAASIPPSSLRILGIAYLLEVPFDDPLLERPETMPLLPLFRFISPLLSLLHLVLSKLFLSLSESSDANSLSLDLFILDVERFVDMRCGRRGKRENGKQLGSGSGLNKTAKNN